MDLERLRLTVAFDGKPFSGWQSQPNRNGVQDHLISAFTRLLEKNAEGPPQIKLYGAGRTDAGVHALGQVAHVDVPKARFAVTVWRSALNAVLPAEIRVLSCRVVPFSFHAQHSAKAKVYQYRIWTGEVLSPLELGRAWHIPRPLSLDRLRASSSVLEGTHDFASFAANRGKVEESTVRTLVRVNIRKRGSLLALEFGGSGFLYRMVRMLTGSLIQVGLARRDLAWLKGLLENPGGPKTTHTAPAHGLYLVRVLY
jgi:tRNA pseudouridine38-40 synthase